MKFSQSLKVKFTLPKMIDPISYDFQNAATPLMQISEITIQIC